MNDTADKSKDYMDKWQATLEEMNAKAEKLSAEQRMKYNKATEDFGAEAEAAGDWAEADWNQFQARVKKWWNELEIQGHEAKE